MFANIQLNFLGQLFLETDGLRVLERNVAD